MEREERREVEKVVLDRWRERERVGAGTECEGDIYRYCEKDKNRGGERERECEGRERWR